MFDINGWEVIVLVIVAIVVLGPERLPEYAAKLGRGVRQLRALAEGARAQLKEQMGPEFDDVNWKAYDPRQYDPRRIVREALTEDPGATTRAATQSAMPESTKPQSARPQSTGSQSTIAPPSRVHDPARPTPWDPDAT